MRIIYFDIDTFRADHVGCYGYHRNTTPNIDKIADEGVKFTNCFCSDAPCLPSRASFFTGRFGIHTGIVGHGGTAADLRLKGKEREFQDQDLNKNWIAWFRRAKIYPVSISPFAERHSAFWFYSGWKEMYNPGFTGYERADEVYPYVEKWLKNNWQMDNWFLHINFWDPHTPYRTPIEFGNPFEDDPAPSWLTQEIIDKQRKSYGPRSATELHGFRASKPPKWHPRLKNLRELKDLDDFKQFIDGYDVGIRYADEYVGKTVEMLKQFGIYDDTLILISSDHGESQGELNVYGDHATACHIVNRVPMIIKWPGKTWKKEVDSFIYQADIAATILEGFNLSVPEIWDGISFYNDLENNEMKGRDYLIISQNAWSCQRTVRFDTWTLIKTYHTGLKDFPKLMLFDCVNDFHMTKNLAEEKPEIVVKGLELLDKWHKEMMESSPSKIDPLNTVIEEGGPYHSRGMKKHYLRQLRKTGREDMAQKIINQNEAD